MAPQTRADAAPAKPRRSRGGVPRCRICNATLSTPAAVLLRRCEGCPGQLDEQLLDKLKDWRRDTARAMNVPAYIVFTDNTLIAIAEMVPTDEAALVAVPGIGAHKLDRFGADVLGLIGRHVRARNSVVELDC
jgi:DNA helicase II / ATP-dependent DNA helicase PcrA